MMSAFACGQCYVDMTNRPTAASPEPQHVLPTCSAFASRASAALVLPARCSVRMAASHSSGCLGLRWRPCSRGTGSQWTSMSKRPW